MNNSRQIYASAAPPRIGSLSSYALVPPPPSAPPIKSIENPNYLSVQAPLIPPTGNFQAISVDVISNMNNTLIKQVADPVDPSDAATKNYVDTHGGGGTPGGSNTDVQYNNLGSFAGSNNFTWNNGSNLLTVSGDIHSDSLKTFSIYLQDPDTPANLVNIEASISTTGSYNLILPVDSGLAGQVLTTDGTGVLSWTAGGGGGDVVGPVSSTNNAMVRFDGITGKLIKDSVIIVDDVGIITGGTWQGTVIDPIYGGTGVNNGTSTLTLGGSLTTSGAFATTFTMTGPTSVTFPTSGTLATTSQLPVPAALTEVDDTNVTLTLGGSPSTALLQATSITAGWTGQLSLTRGGTNNSLTASAGGIVWSDASKLNILSGTATANQLLVSGASVTPAWSSNTWPTTNILGDILYGSGTNTITTLAGNTTTGIQYLSQTGTGLISAAPVWNTISGGDITGAALTKTDDTNVTLTLGGSPATALLRATSITAGWTGQLSLTRGGTNNSLTASAGGIVWSDASKLNILSGTATAGQLLQSGASATPSWTTSTYPATNSANTLLYASALNTMAELPTANNGVLITSALGVPSISSTLPSAVQGNITTVGTITSGTWNGSVIGPTYGGTGVNNGTSTLTLGGNLTTSGAFASTFTMTGPTSVTFPTSGTLATTSGASIPGVVQGDTLYGSATNVISTLAKNTTATRYLANTGTLNNPAWDQVNLTNGVTGVLPSANGGTGVNNGSSTITLGGSLTTSGAFGSTFTMTNTTSVTFPTSGTLATTSQLPTPAALTKVDDTNITLTLGGSPSTALLQATSITAGWTGQLGLTRGGTNNTLTASAGGIVWSDASKLNILSGTATANQMLQSGASVTPAWSSNTWPATNILGDTLYGSGSNVISILAGNTTTGIQYLSQTGTGVVSAAPVWNTISGGDITGAALTKVDDTNVTLTLGGTPATCLLRAASITAGWTGQLSLTRGGTNNTLVASNGGIVWSDASKLNILSGTATARQMLQSGASATPAWSTATYPATTTVNQLLYSSNTNVISGLSTFTNAVLVTDGSGVPSISRTIPNPVLWNGSIIGATYGGTGVNNGSSTITLGGNLTTSGAFASTFTMTGITTVTFPTSGTLATTAGANIPSIAQGDLLYGSATNVLSALAKNTTATRYLANTGTSNNPNWDQVNITNGITNSTSVSGTPGTTGSVFAISAQTFTDNNTAGSGTATSQVFQSIAQPTLAATNASVTTTDAATVYIAGAPIQGTNETITNRWALWAPDSSSNAKFGGNVFATSFQVTSDINLKTGVKGISDSLEKLKRIEGCEYNWKDKNMGEERQYGVIAQQLEKIGLGNLVSTKGANKSVNYMGIIPILIESIKELNARIEKLEKS